MPTKKIRRAPPKRPAKAAAGERLKVETVNVPGYTHEVDAVRYRAMHRVLLEVLPARAPGLTQSEMWTAAADRAPKALFPDRGKIAWWAKTVQLDQEAKGAFVREPGKPLRWHRVTKR